MSNTDGPALAGIEKQLRSIDRRAVPPAGEWLASADEMMDGVWEIGRLDLNAADDDVLVAPESVVKFGHWR